MNIKTIVSHPNGCGFYVSAALWNDPIYAITHRAAGDDWRYVGSRGWYVTEENKSLYEQLDNLVGLSDWYPGEFMTVDIEAQP